MIGAHQNARDAGSTRLSDVAAGASARVVRVTGGHQTAARLAAMGFTPAAEVGIIRNDGSGPLVVSIKGSRIMLGRGVAHKLLVRASDRSPA